MNPALKIVSGHALPDPPYPAETRAGSYLFAFDMGRLEFSDTWAVTPADLRPWLLMLWASAWGRTPCASFTDDDEVIAAAIGMPLGQFQTHRKVLMRGWRKHSDCRLYHDYMTTRVHEMRAGRAKFAERQQRHRTTNQQVKPHVTRDTTVTNGVSRADVDVDVDMSMNESTPKPRATAATRVKPTPLLPAGVRQETWVDWCKAKGRKLNDAAYREQVAFLAMQPDPDACVKQSLRNCWAGLYPTTRDRGGGRATKAEKLERVASEMFGGANGRNDRNDRNNADPRDITGEVQRLRDE